MCVIHYRYLQEPFYSQLENLSFKLFPIGEVVKKRTKTAGNFSQTLSSTLE